MQKLLVHCSLPRTRVFVTSHRPTAAKTSDTLCDICVFVG
jgi:hypothetical protein